jgi:hypothetical protein
MKKEAALMAGGVMAVDGQNGQASNIRRVAMSKAESNVTSMADIKMSSVMSKIAIMKIMATQRNINNQWHYLCVNGHSGGNQA